MRHTRKACYDNAQGHSVGPSNPWGKGINHIDVDCPCGHIVVPPRGGNFVNRLK